MPDNSSHQLSVDMKGFETYLASQQFLPSKKIPYYLHWVSQFYTHSNKTPEQSVTEAEIKLYLRNLAQRKEEWQIAQAQEAIQL